MVSTVTNKQRNKYISALVGKAYICSQG